MLAAGSSEAGSHRLVADLPTHPYELAGDQMLSEKQRDRKE
jgi:hypothetical protein